MPRKRKYTDDQLVEAVKTSASYYQVLTKIGLKLCGGSHAHTKMRVRQLGLDTSHFTGQGWCKGEHQKRVVDQFVRIPLEDILVRDSTYQCTPRLKKRLIAEGLLRNECYVCGMGPEWNGKPLVLQLDHIDGDRCNNMKENLRIICPNCHSQTGTYCGRNKKPR